MAIPADKDKLVSAFAITGITIDFLAGILYSLLSTDFATTLPSIIKSNSYLFTLILKSAVFVNYTLTSRVEIPFLEPK